MAETALAFAMKKAGGGDLDAMLLRSVAYAELGKVNRDIMRALGPFLEEVRDAGGLMVKMIRPETARREALEYLRGAAAEMARVPAKVGDGVQCASDSHHHSGPVEEKAGGGGVHEGGDCRHAHSPPSPAASSEGDRVHGATDSHGASSPSPSETKADGASIDGLNANEKLARSSAPNAEGGSSPIVPTSSVVARTSATPNKPRGLAAMKAANAVEKSILETRMLTDGTPYGRARWQTLLRRAEVLLTASIGNVREAALMYLTHEHARPPEPNCLVLEVIKPDVALELMRRADRITPEALRVLIQCAAQTAEMTDA